MTFRTRALGLEGYYSGLGFEDAEVEQAIEGEELVQSVQESTELQTEVTNDLATVERLEQQASGLEDIAAINENLVEEAGDGELALTEVAADLASVGTDIEGAEEMVPALESFKGRKISMEGIKDTAKQIWAAIKAFMRKIWEKIVAFWRRITDQVPSVVKAARKLQARAEATAGKTLKDDGKKTKISASEGKGLVIDGKKASGFSDLVKGLDAISSVAEGLMRQHAGNVKHVGDKIAEAMESFNLDKPDDSLNAVNKEALMFGKHFADFADKKISGDKRFSKDLAVVRSEHLPGDVAIFAQAVMPAGGKSTSVLGDAQMVRSMRVSLMASSEKPKEHTGEFSIDTLSSSDCDTLADKIIDIMGVMKKFQEKQRRDLELAGDKVTKAGDKMSSKPDDKTSANAVKCYQSALSYGGTYAQWCASPFMSVLSHILATSRTVISVANKSLSQYKA